MMGKKALYYTGVTLLIFAGILGRPQTTVAQENPDHLMCYKVKDATRFQGTYVNIDSNQFGALDNCRIRKPVEYCVPAAKEVLSVGPGVEPVPFFGSPAAGDYLCYRVECPSDQPVPEAQGVIDQFGSREVDQFTTFRFCTPAMKDQCGDPQRRIFAPEELGGCQQFADRESECGQAWQFSRGTGKAVSCFFGTNVNGRRGCFGCGPNNEAGAACNNSCEGTPTPTCQDPSRSVFLSQNNRGCRYFSSVPAACELAWQLSRGTGEPTSCFLGPNINGNDGCFGCGPNNEDGGVCSNICR